MRFARLHNSSVLRRLSLSFAAVVVATAILISIPLVQVFTVQYNNRVIDMNRQLLDQYARTINDAFIGQIRKVYVDFCLNVSHATDINILFAPELSGGKVYLLNNEMQKITSSSQGMVEAIHVYSATNDLVLSSMIGLRYNHPQNRGIWPVLSTLSETVLRPGNTYWSGARELYYTRLHYSNVVTFVGAYPTNRELSRAQGSVSIDVRADRILEVLVGFNPEMSDLLLFDSDGGLIAHTGEEPFPRSVSEMGYDSLAQLARVSSAENSIEFYGKRALVSCKVIDNGWMLVNVIPMDTFNAATRNVAVWSFAITAVAVALCIWLSSRALRGVISPLRAIITRIRHLISQTDAATSNEFAYIDSALTEMSVRINDLNKTWEDNIPSLKQNLLHSLVNQTSLSAQVFHRNIDILIKRPAEGRYCVLLAHLINCEDAQGVPETINRELIRHIEDLSAPNRRIIAAELSATCIGALVISESGLPVSLLTGACAFARRSLGIDITLALGSWQDNPLNSHISYRDALEASRRYFFAPWDSIFTAETQDAAPETSPGAAPETAYDAVYDADTARDDIERCIIRFQNALIHGEKSSIPVIIQVFTRAVRSAPLCCDDKHAYLAKMTGVLGEYARNMFPGKDVFAVRYPVDSVTDIQEFDDWLSKTVDMVYEWKTDDSDTQALDTIAAIKQYILNNLGKELSLTSLAEHTALSNSYISHAFKERTGIGLVDYVTQQRMLRAKELLMDTSRTIESIARQLGYHTPHYFAKRFRQYYGITPHQYRTGNDTDS